MLTVSGTTIRIPKGDIGSVRFHFTEGVPESTETVYLIVSSYPEADTPLIQKTGTVSSGYVTFSFGGTDTNLSPDRYVYALRVAKTGGYDTPICTGEFEILEVVKI